MMTLLSRSHRRNSSFDDAGSRDGSRRIDGREEDGSDATVLRVVCEKLLPVGDALKTSETKRELSQERGRKLEERI